MKTITTIIAAVALLVLTPMQAQTADEILDNYFENTGGADAWNALEGVKMTANVNAQGMEIPVEIYQTKDGKQLVKINFQGQEITQLAFDGETMWSTNFMTMQAEKSDTETTENMKKTMKDFPSPLLNYKEKGFSVELMGDETMEGTETFKIKLTQDPVMVDGKEVPNVSYYYFEKENFVPIAVEAEIRQGPAAGQMSKSTMSDYEEVDGLYFPFSMSQGGQPFSITEIQLNPEINMSMFKFPEAAASGEKK
jgi:outer membrane lipoprotein-sorting protein